MKFEKQHFSGILKHFTYNLVFKKLYLLFYVIEDTEVMALVSIRNNACNDIFKEGNARLSIEICKNNVPMQKILNLYKVIHTRGFNFSFPLLSQLIY